jgi:periplasmic copper chaperone A
MQTLARISGILMVFAIITACSSTPEADIVIEEPWIRGAPSNAPALGGFMTIHNHTDKAVKLVSANVDSGYERLELHRTVAADGMMKMIKQQFIPVPAEGSVILKPGDWHVMLIGPASVPKVGDSVAVSLTFDNGQTLAVDMPVKAGDGMMKHAH